MTQVNVHEAKTNLSRLLARDEAGEETVIARNGRPVAKLVPHVEQRKPREPGWAKGRLWMAPDFDDSDEQIARDFRLADETAPRHPHAAPRHPHAHLLGARRSPRH
jgi:prevent-host-death family protein